eukprot:gnl/Dysnectes_brevis/3543_a4502_530.p1 GENE.gnl/Dysnectes_brevis/3543_a4502_530~~gnl/Dysnectes_brevis/3543_a4502_530.p1  ORF type:complete len:467 (-),score=96.60 gnl/Dysnectes_brevis/3543_a4502_530:270-1670(-)
MREIITIQVGQCGNQIGCEYWRTLLKEHKCDVRSLEGTFTDSMSSVFQNVSRSGRNINPVSPIEELRSRSVLIDMEEGVLNQLLTSDLEPIFDPALLVSASDGSGNNFAEGFIRHGSDHGEAAMDRIQTALEAADSPQALIFLHSLGGGTGSGFGSAVLERSSDLCSGMSLISAPVVPSREQDDVVTSPYNAMLALASLAEHADLVIPFDNQAIGEAVLRAQRSSHRPVRGRGLAARQESVTRAKRSRPFAEVNGIVSTALSGLTAGMRFGGEMNVDINELAINLVPFSALNFVTSALSPIPGLPAPRSKSAAVRALFTPDTQLICPSGCNALSLSAAVLARGVDSGTVGTALDQVIAEGLLKRPEWAPPGCKLGICSSPPARGSYGLLGLRNGPQVMHPLRGVHAKFEKLYRKRVFLHHYTKWMDQADIEARVERVRGLVDGYNEVERTSGVMRQKKELPMPVIF